MQALMEDETDYKQLLKNKEASPEDRNRWSDMYGLRALCRGVNRKLDAVFAELFDKEAV